MIYIKNLCDGFKELLRFWGMYFYLKTKFYSKTFRVTKFFFNSTKYVNQVSVIRGSQIVFAAVCYVFSNIKDIGVDSVLHRI